MDCRGAQSSRLRKPGKNRDEALGNIKEAIECHVQAMEALGEKVPEDTLEALLVTV